MRVLALFLVLAALSGCGAEPGAAAGCEADGCPAGSSCQEGVCLSDAPEDYPVALRLIPPRDEGPAQWEGPRALSSLGHVFRFERLAELRGSLRGDALRGSSAGAHIELTRPSTLPGREPQSFGTTAPDGDFTIRIPPGDAYEVRATPLITDAAWAPFRLALDVDDSTDITLDLPGTTTVRGAITRSGGQPQENARVWAVDPDTNRALSSLAIARAAADSPAIRGDFEVALLASTERFLLRVAGTDETPGLPTVDFGPFEETNLIFHPEDDSLEIPLAALTYPALGGLITLKGKVEGTPRGGGRVDIAGASLRFTSHDLGEPGIDDVQGTVERLVTSQSDGFFKILLYKGTYDVEVVPPAAAAYADLAVARVSQLVNADESLIQQGIVIEVPARSTLAGRVVGPAEAPLAEAQLTVAGGGDLADLAIAAAEPRNRSAIARASAEGAFLVQLDQGHFDVTVRSPPQSGLPWALFPDVLVTDDVAAAQTFVVSPGQRVRGSVQDADNQPYAGVTVEVWCLDPAGQSAQCATAITDGSGAYDILLPASGP